MKLHRVGDKLGLNKVAIEDGMFNIPSLFTQRKTILFTDLTNTYFEGNAESISLAKRGFSKEKRFDCPLISLAVCINQDGYVIKSLFLPGNVSEPTALPDLLGKTNAANGNFWVMDKGIATKENLEWLERENYFYVVADRRHRREFDQNLATEIITDSGSKIEIYRVDDETCPGRVKLLCHSFDRETKEIAMIDKSSIKLEGELNKLNLGLSKPRTVKDTAKIQIRIGRLLEKFSVAAPYYSLSVIPSDSNEKIASAVTFEKKETEGSKSELPGVYSILTNDPSMTDEEILQTYLSLTSIESVFRCLKSELGLRPNFHKIGRRVNNHIFISLLAYQVVNYIRNAFEKHGIHDSWKTIRDAAEEQKMVVSLAKANRCKKAVKITNYTNLTSPMSSYYHSLGLDKEVMKPTYTYVSQREWEEQKKANY
jgi:transposase